MPATDADWVLAVDVRGPQRTTATAGADGVRAGDGTGAGRPPLAVVVVHPGSWPAEQVAQMLDEVAGGYPAAGEGGAWPAPVPLATAEAASWRALEFGLVPRRGRLVVLDPRAGEAGVVDRDGDTLAAVGAVVGLEGRPRDAEHLLALAREALRAAPAGPPFAGVLLAGTLPGASDDAALPGLVARETGRAPLVPGDADRVAVLGAAALGWAAATAAADGQAAAPASPAAPAGPRVARRQVGEVPELTGAPLPAGRRWPRPRGPLAWAAVVLVALVVVAVVAGLGWHRSRTAPSPYTVTCPDGQVVAYGFECPTLAPSP